MADLADFLAMPPLRCGALLGDSAAAWCGAPASFLRPGANALDVSYRCDRHRRRGDQPLPAALLLRRVSVRLDVLVAGVTMQQQLAEAEALQRVELALQLAGAVVNLHAVSSAVGQGKRPGGLQERRRLGGVR